VAASALCLAAAPRLNPSVERGAEVAQSRCASCHGVALEAASPSRDAPLFRVLSRLYSAQDLQRKLSNISQNGHFEMPAISIREDEIEDVSAYIASLDGRAAAVPPTCADPPPRPAVHPSAPRTTIRSGSSPGSRTNPTRASRWT
jgi:mono/diheme cytochrome c family protein